jgi:GTP cyclohydrolase II/arylamine N-acetyltransferase/glycosyltransferase involved in cell wall biosynthesis
MMPRADTKVVVVIATHGKDRTHMLKERALKSVAAQTRPPNLVIVVSDNHDHTVDVVTEKAIASVDMLEGVERMFLQNTRTKHRSGTGAWNTGIYRAFEHLGEETWIAILDDDDEWAPDHIKTCLQAVSVATSKAVCDPIQWVISGLIRREQDCDYQEPIPDPAVITAIDFFCTNPGIQGSNLFVNLGLVMRSGMFDENLESTTDRDLCVRMCDVIGADNIRNCVISTGKHTVIHHADFNRTRVSNPENPHKRSGLRKFFYKHAPRMSSEQRSGFIKRACEKFGCNPTDFVSKVHSVLPEDSLLLMWAGDSKAINTGTKKHIMPVLQEFKNNCNREFAESEKHKAIFGMICSNSIARVSPLLHDLAAAASSKKSNWWPYVVLFANSSNPTLERDLEGQLCELNLKGHVIIAEDPWVKKRVMTAACDGAQSFPLPIHEARTVLQQYLYRLGKMLKTSDEYRVTQTDVAAIVVLDDDKRLPMGWTPIVADDELAFAFFGSDIRTPPNVKVASMATQLIDVVHGLDRLLGLSAPCTVSAAQLLTFDSVQSGEPKNGDPRDAYYDYSSYRTDHLEFPRPIHLQSEQDISDFVAHCQESLLRGTPLARDAIPAMQPGTGQRGGCMVIRSEGGWEALGTEQVAIEIPLPEGTRNIYSRRSDTIWSHTNTSALQKEIVGHPSLCVYHDNTFDSVASCASLRAAVVSELCGAVLAKETPEEREELLRARSTTIKARCMRVRGLLQALCNREYFEANEDVLRPFVSTLRSVFDEHRWQTEVFDVIHREGEKWIEWTVQHRTSVGDGFSMKEVDGAKQTRIQADWIERERVSTVHNDLRLRFPQQSFDFVGAGCEGVVFRSVYTEGPGSEPQAYKVFDNKAARAQILGKRLLFEKFNAVLLIDSPDGQVVIVQRPFIDGLRYTGGHGVELVRLLRWMRTNNVCTDNFSPENVILDQEKGELHVVDIGRDVHACNPDRFLRMAMRAFLCFRFGQYEKHPHDLRKLKHWMRATTQTVSGLPVSQVLETCESNVPQLSFFRKFWSVLNDCADGTNNRLRSALEKYERAGDVGPPPVTLQASVSDQDITCRVKELHRDSEIGAKVAIVVEAPFDSINQQLHPALPQRRQLGYFRRVLLRCGFKIVYQTCVEFPCCERFETRVETYLFVIEKPPDAKPCSTKATQIASTYLLIKTCPMEQHSILADVRRTVQTLQKSTCFKEVVLLVDWSRRRGFLRQYDGIVRPIDGESIDKYSTAVQILREERCVDRVLEFCGKESESRAINKKWFGLDDCSATHSTSGPQYASTLFGFEQLRQLPHFEAGDLVLQMDSDVIWHVAEDCCFDICDAVAKQFAANKDMVTWGCPIPTVTPSPGGHHHLGQKKPYRVEVRCAFFCLDTLIGLLPLPIPEDMRAETGNESIIPGWYRVLDRKFQNMNWVEAKLSVRGSFGSFAFFTHPQNVCKREGSRHLLVADRFANTKFGPQGDEEGSVPGWQKQLGKVDLVAETQLQADLWLGERKEPIIFVMCGRDVIPGRFLRCIQSLAKQRSDTDTADVGYVVLDDATDNYEDIREYIFEETRRLLGSNNVTTINTGTSRGTQANRVHAVKTVCTNPESVVITLDSDDCLLSGQTVELVRSIFGMTNETPFGTRSEKGFTVQCAMGGMIRTDKATPYPLTKRDPRRSVRGAGNVWKHLRCFRKSLFDQIDDQDLRNKNGVYFKHVTDWAAFLPVVEGALPRRIVDIDRYLQAQQCQDDALYLYEPGFVDHAMKREALDMTAGEVVAQPKVEETESRAGVKTTIVKAYGPLHGVAFVQHGRSFPTRGHGNDDPEILLDNMWVSKRFKEGDLDSIQLVAEVAGESYLKQYDMVPVRVHSECFTGDVVDSCKCDCGLQSRWFRHNILKKAKCGVLVHILGHEGRGCGVYSKAKSYAQMAASDTLDHNESLRRLGVPCDSRLYDAAAQFLRDVLGIRSVRLYSNNPEKGAAMYDAFGGDGVEICAMRSGMRSEHCRQYLEQKVQGGHSPSLLEDDEGGSFAAAALKSSEIREYFRRIHLSKELQKVASGFCDRRGESMTSTICHDDRLELLCAITRGTLAYIPCQNFTMLAGPRAPPSPCQIIDAMVSGRGGLCIIRTPFLFLLLKQLGYEVGFVCGTTNLRQSKAGASAMHTNEPMQGDHFGLLVHLGSITYWCDVGNGYPYLEPLQIPSSGNTSKVVHHPYRSYRLRVEHQHRDGLELICFVEHAHTMDFFANYSFPLKECSYAAFAQMRERHYQDRGYGPFLTSLRFNVWMETQGIVIKDQECLVLGGEIDGGGEKGCQYKADSPDDLKSFIDSKMGSGFLEAVGVDVDGAWKWWQYERVATHRRPN